MAVPDISDAALEADILIFVLPHQFIKRACGPLNGKLKQGATGLSLIKVIEEDLNKFAEGTFELLRL